MIRFFCVLTLFLASSTLTLAFDISNMTDRERTKFGEEVRQYLLKNPSVIVDVFQVLEERKAEESQQHDKKVLAQHADAIFSDNHSWVGGNPNGDIALVEFLDYRCGYCRRAAPEVARLLAEDSNLKLIVKEFPILGDSSVLMARFAIATLRFAGAEAYKKVHDALIELEGDAAIDTLRALATDLNLDANVIFAHLDDPHITDAIEANYELARVLNISGTPSFILPNIIIRGFLPAAKLQERITSAREQG